MKKPPIPLILYFAAACLSLAPACQSPSRPNKSPDSAVAPAPKSYMDYPAELSLAFSKARKDTFLSRLIGAKSGDQVKLLTREVPLLWGDFTGDGAEDVIAAFNVLTPADELYNYGVFIRDSSGLRMVQVIPRGTGTSDAMLTLESISDDGTVWASETVKSKEQVWTIRYKWGGSRLDVVVKAPFEPPAGSQ